MTQLSGNVSLDNRMLAALVTDSGANDGDFTNDGILVDLNGDGEFSRQEEYVAADGDLETESARYVFDIGW